MCDSFANIEKSKIYRDVMATIWHDHPEELETFKEISNKYYIIGNEIAPTTGRPHWQCYGQFKQTRGSTLMKKMPNTDFRRYPDGKHSPFSCREYCAKGGDFIESGEITKQGKRSDIQLVKEMVQSGANMREIIDNTEINLNYQTLKCAELMRKYITPKRNCKPTVIWIYGPTGVGKSHWADEYLNNKYGEYFTVDLAPWWDGYDGQKGVLFEEFRGEMVPYRQILRWTDKYEVRLPIKGTSAILMAETIIFTSCKTPRQCYEGVNEDIGQFLRRFDEIWYMPSRGEKILMKM